MLHITKRLPQGQSLKFRLLKLSMLPLTGSLRLLLTAYRGLLIVLSLTNLSEYTGSCAGALETTKCTVEGLAFFYSDL